MEPRVTYYTCHPTNSIHPIDLAYQCASAWADRWTIQYDDWLYYGSTPDDDYVDESEWINEVNRYRSSTMTDYESSPEDFRDELDRKIHESLSWEPLPAWRRDKRAYARTAAQSRRDKSVHARGRTDQQFDPWNWEHHPYDDVLRRKDGAFVAATAGDYEQDANFQCEMELLEQHPGLKRIWVDEFLKLMKRKIQLEETLAVWERWKLESLNITVKDLEHEIEAENQDADAFIGTYGSTKPLPKGAKQARWAPKAEYNAWGLRTA